MPVFTGKVLDAAKNNISISGLTQIIRSTVVNQSSILLLPEIYHYTSYISAVHGNDNSNLLSRMFGCLQIAVLKSPLDCAG